METKRWKEVASAWGRIDDQRYKLEAEGRKMWLKLEIERRQRTVKNNQLFLGSDDIGPSVNNNTVGYELAKRIKISASAVT